jgi:hypothetical protein
MRPVRVIFGGDARQTSSEQAMCGGCNQAPEHVDALFQFASQSNQIEVAAAQTVYAALHCLRCLGH